MGVFWWSCHDNHNAGYFWPSALCLFQVSAIDKSRPVIDQSLEKVKFQYNKLLNITLLFYLSRYICSKLYLVYSHVALS